MNIFKELKRVEEYKPLDPWLQQNGIVCATWGKTIVIEIKLLNQDSVKSMYLPTFSNGRYLEIHKLSVLQYYDRLCSAGYFLGAPYV